MAKKHSKVLVSDTMWGLVKQSFGLIFKNWKIFLPLILIAGVIWTMLVGASEDTIILMLALIILTLWLVTIFVTRHVLKGNEVRLRDGLFHAMTPLWSSMIILVLLAIECLPIFLVVIGYSSAIETNLFADAFAGSLFVLFAIAMVALSLYLFSETLMAMVAVSAPGMYPLTALKLTREVMVGEKIKFILRLIVMGMALAVVWLVIVGISFLIDLWLNNLTAIVFGMFFAGCFSVIFAGVYLYLYYRKVLMMEEK